MSGGGGRDRVSVSVLLGEVPHRWGLGPKRVLPPREKQARPLEDEKGGTGPRKEVGVPDRRTGRPSLGRPSCMFVRSLPALLTSEGRGGTAAPMSSGGSTGSAVWTATPCGRGICDTLRVRAIARSGGGAVAEPAAPGPGGRPGGRRPWGW